MNTYTPNLNLPSRKKKGLIKLFGGVAAPWYFISTATPEGTVVKPDLGTADRVIPVAATEGALAFGFLMQETYDDTVFGQLKNYHFANDTRQRLDGQPVGVLMGAGWALTNYYSGAVSYGVRAGIGASGKMKDGTGDAGNNKLPVIFEGAGNNGDTMVRVRFDFPVAP